MVASVGVAVLTFSNAGVDVGIGVVSQRGAFYRRKTLAKRMQC